MSGAALDIRHTMDRLAARLGLMREDRLAAAVRALNRTMTTVRAQAARDLRPYYPGIKVAALKARLKLQRATRAKPVAAVVFSGKRFPLFGNFGMRGVGRWGVRFRGLPWRIETISGEAVSPEVLGRAFRQRSGRSGRADVFSRLARPRASFEILVAPGLARALTEQRVGVTLVRLARSRFAVVYQQEARFRLAKGR